MASSKLCALCHGIIEAGWLAAVVMTPLYYNGYSSTVVEPDKLALLRTIISIMAAAWFVQWIDQWRSPRPQPTLSLRSPLVFSMVLLVAVYLLATFTSIVPRVSFFGAYHRPQGTYAMLSYIVVFAMILHGLRTRQQLDRLILTIILTSFPVALYGIYQHFDLDPQTWNGTFGDRIASTLGNPIFLAAYLIMLFPLTLVKILGNLRALWVAKRVMVPEILGVAGYALIACVQSGAIIFAASRGPWLGWFAGVLLFVVLLALVFRQRRFVIGVLGLGFASAIFLIVLNLPNASLEPLRALPGLDRLGHLTNATGEFRLFTWSNAARLVMPHAPVQFPDGTPDRLNVIRPLVGYGPDAMALVYPQVSLPDPFALEMVTDRSHNETWDALVTTGVLGFAAYQLLFLSIFFYGLRWLGLLETERARNLFIALWIGLGLAGGLGAMLIGRPGYLGLSVPAGNLAAVLIILIRAAIQMERTPSETRHFSDCLLLLAVLAGLGGHYVESQFGIAVPATRVMLFVLAGILWVLHSRKLESAVTPATSPVSAPVAARRAHVPIWAGNAASYAIIVGMVLTTLLFGFLGYSTDVSDPLTIIWRALSFNSAHSTTSYAMLGLLVSVSLLAMILALSEMARSETTRRATNWRGAWMLLAIIPFAFTAVFVVGLASQIGALLYIPSPGVHIEDVVTLSGQVIRIVDYYSVSLFALILLMAIALFFESQPLPHAWSAQRWSALAAVPILLVTLFLVNTINLNPIRADVAYRLGKLFEDQIEWDAAIALDKQAIAFAPANDAYYMALGRAYQYKARTANPDAASFLNSATPRSAILNLDSGQTAKLGRLDLLYATQTMLLYARDLNPLYPDHTLNLARFYVPEPPLNTPSKSKLADLSNQYYAEAIRLNLTSPPVWNEWADFDLTTRGDPPAALQKLNAALTRDAKFVPTYLNLGKVYAAQNDFAKAGEAYQRALTLQPDLAEAQSKLAFAYYQQGKRAESIAAYLKYIELAPNAPNLWEAHKNLALLFEQTGDPASAIQAARAATRLAPPEAQSALAELEARLGNQARTP